MVSVDVLPDLIEDAPRLAVFLVFAVHDAAQEENAIVVPCSIEENHRQAMVLVDDDSGSRPVPGWLRPDQPADFYRVRMTCRAVRRT